MFNWFKKLIFGHPAKTVIPLPKPTSRGTKRTSPHKERVHNSTPSQSNSEDGMLESMALGYALDDGIVGGLIGGNLTGGIIGDMLNSSDETKNYSSESSARETNDSYPSYQAEAPDVSSYDSGDSGSCDSGDSGSCD